MDEDEALLQPARLESTSEADELTEQIDTEHRSTTSATQRSSGELGTTRETPELSVEESAEQHSSECTSEPPQLTVHRITQTGTHVLNPEDLVHCSTAVVFNDPTAIRATASTPNIVLTSVFNNAPILTVSEPAKSDVSILTKVHPSDVLLHKSHQDLGSSGSVLLSSTSQTALLIPGFYQENDHLIQVAPGSTPLYQNTPSTALYGHVAQNHPCQWKDCDERFASVEELVDHLNNTHVLANKEPCEYSCLWKNCIRRGKGFNARYKLLIHLRTHTGERPHACHFERCDKRFSRLENLKIHCRTHTGEKPYVCPFEGCEKRYSNSSDRFKHTRTHIESKPYRCKVDGCFKQYTDPSSLRKHLKAHKL